MDLAERQRCVRLISMMKVPELKLLYARLGMQRSGTYLRKPDLRALLSHFCQTNASQEQLNLVGQVFMTSHHNPTANHLTSNGLPAPPYAVHPPPPRAPSDHPPSYSIPIPDWAKPSLASTSKPTAAVSSDAITPPPSGSVVRCLCGSGTSSSGPFLQCKGKQCGIFQHCECVGQGLVQGKRPFESWSDGFGGYLCEKCRGFNITDPFFEVVSELVPAGLLRKTGRTVLVGATSQPQIAIERTFTLTQQQQQGLRSGLYQVKVYSICLNDSVPNRWCWPTGTLLNINGMQVRSNNRQPHLKLGAQGRDDTVDISGYCLSSSRVTLSCSSGDARTFCLGASLTVKRSTEAVKSLMMATPSMQESQVRICSHLSSYDEVEVHSATISLKDPMTGVRIKKAARFSNGTSQSCFDLDTFLDIASRSRKWQCPHTLIDSSISLLCLDPFTQAILNSVSSFPDVLEIEINPHGKWRPAGPGGSSVDFLYLYPGEPYVKQTASLADEEEEEEKEEEEDEFESLRKESRALLAAGSQDRVKCTTPGGKRKRDESQKREVIVID